MLEAYLFLAVFPVQILAMSVLYPIRFDRLMRAGLAKIPDERLAEIYPDVDVVQAHERFLSRFRAANAVVVLLGVALLGWFISYMQRPVWDAGTVSGLLTTYFLLQNFPIVMAAWLTNRFDKVHKRPSPDARRKAILQRRGPLDFVSPYVILFAVLSYLVFVAFNFYVAQDPFPGYAGPFVNIAMVTLMILLGGCGLYWFLYLKKPDPLQTLADRMNVFRVVVNAYAWMCILIPAFLSLHFARRLLDLETWNPLAGTFGFLILSLLNLRGVFGLRAQPGADGTVLR